MTGAEKAALAARYDERKPYAFAQMGRPDREQGKHRYRGPALIGKVRCPNNPKSMRLDASSRPTTDCARGEPCACGTTVTLGPDDHFGTRQHDLYGTTVWKASYGRRSAVESANANLNTHHAQLQRGSTRVLGTTRTGILLAFILAAVNTSVLHSRYAYDIGSPPAGDGPIKPLPTPRQALHRRRPFARRPARRKRPPGHGPSPNRPARRTEGDFKSIT